MADAEPHRADSAKPVVEAYVQGNAIWTYGFYWQPCHVACQDDNYFDLLKPAADEQMEQAQSQLWEW